MPLFKYHLSRPLCLAVFAFLLSACEGEISTNDDAIGYEPSPVTNDLNDNDDYFHAFGPLSQNTLYSDTLSAEDMVDYFIVPTPTTVYKTYEVSLTNLTGDADLEVMNAYASRVSWSENEGVEDENIKYWRGYTKREGSIIYVKVINRSGSNLSYDLEIN